LQATIEAIRDNLGAPPRQFGWLASRYNRPSRPLWLTRSDPLCEQYRASELLLTHGSVVWGALIQANELLFKWGPSDSPAMVLFAPDESMDAHPAWLATVAVELYSLKGASADDPEERNYGAMLADEMERALGWTVPARISGGKLLKSTSIVVCRRHLPRGVLSENIFPLLIHEDTPAAMIVPSRYWPRI
jgi:hypothetical protein